ncbi:MAG: glycosyltransferase [Akkermansiaceae bacterium]|nr:glycosyltransferase [Akkermansiaceae bacterium]
MKIAMFTNTYLPHVGGVARSVKTLEDACRMAGHEVKVIAPNFLEQKSAPDVLRVPAVQNFNGSDFSMRIPVPNLIREFIEDFKPDVIHSHHPFLLGDAALREAWKMQVPIIFTNHTLYERYTHYVPLDSTALKRVVIQLGTEYCNLCDQVIAPSGSIARLLRERGVVAPIEVIPTGVDIDFFANGDSLRFRQAINIPQQAMVIGHVGRLAKEKNVLFLADAVATALHDDPSTVFLVVGDGEHHRDMMDILRQKAPDGQIHAVGKLTGQDLADAYAAMDCFVFASQTETQGLVLAEAMAAGIPVVALDGPGVREIVRHDENGLLLNGKATADEFALVIGALIRNSELLKYFKQKSKETAVEYGAETCVQCVIECYEKLIAHDGRKRKLNLTAWDRLLSGIEIEWDLFVEKLSAGAAAVVETQATKAHLD